VNLSKRASLILRFSLKANFGPISCLLNRKKGKGIDMNKYELIKYIKESSDNISNYEVADALCDGEYLDKLNREIDFDQETVEDAHDFLTS
jgi:hypothetical protein